MSKEYAYLEKMEKEYIDAYLERPKNSRDRMDMLKQANWYNSKKTELLENSNETN